MAGFQVSSTQSSNSTGMGIKRYEVPASETANIAIGDIVILNGTSNSLTGLPQVIRADAVNPFITFMTGVVVGADFDVTNLYTTGVTGSSGGFVYVSIDPDLYFDADADATIPEAAVGQNIPFIADASTITGVLMISGMQLDGSAHANTATLPFRIIELLRDSAGVLGNRARVRMNASTQSTNQVGV